MDVLTDLSPLSPGLIDELEAFMAPVTEVGYPPTDSRRLGNHQLPESPPDSGSEHPYSPDVNTINPVMNTDFMIHIPQHDIIQNGEYIYEELKSDSMGQLSDVVVLNTDPNIVDIGHQYHRYTQMRLDMDIEPLNQQIVIQDSIPVYTNLQEPNTKKRKLSQDQGSQVKCEPATNSPDIVTASLDGSEDDAPFQCIRFGQFQQSSWHALYDHALKLISPPNYVVGADKGFNFSQIDEAFVCQKKNHFQVTCQVHITTEPHYVKTSEGYKKINGFFLHFYGVKAEDPSQEVRIEQSQSDRTKKPFHPVPVDLRREGSKITIGRLHFAETTNNNMRKKGRPNPDQRHFQLVVALRAHCQHGDYMVAANASDRIIVRASNPGQFESDCSENWWQRGVSENSVHFNGKVGINTDRPDESCVINGNLKVMGHIVHPSDARAKHNIEELDTAQQLKNVQSIRVVKFNYDASFASHCGLLGVSPSAPPLPRDTGVIAQEVREVIPEAVREAGHVTLHNGRTIDNFLVVNKDRIFMENLGAVKELCKVTGNLESRIDQLERINKKLCKVSILQRNDSTRSGSSDNLSLASKSTLSDTNISMEQVRNIARNIRRQEQCNKLSHNSYKYTKKHCRTCHTGEKRKKCAESAKSECESAEIVTNKFLHIVITVLISIMAVCLIVMSALYFREHQELLNIKQLRLNEKLHHYTTYGKFSVNTSPMQYKTTDGHNQIQNSKHPQYVAPKKSTKDKGPHKQPDFVTSSTTFSTPDPYVLSTTSNVNNIASTQTHPKSYVKNALDIEQPAIQVVPTRRVSQLRSSEVVGTGCVLDNALNADLDGECQSSCTIDHSAYENEPTDQESKIELNLTHQDKHMLIPIAPETIQNNTSMESLNKRLRDEISIADLNQLDGNKVLLNATENETISRLKRHILRLKRSAAEVSHRGGSDEMVLEQQSDEVFVPQDCDTVTLGLNSKTISNDTVFIENVCSNVFYNFTYSLPVSKCLKEKHIDIAFRSKRLKQLRLCGLKCKYDKKTCQLNREIAKPVLDTESWTSKLTLECDMDKEMIVRAAFDSVPDLCFQKWNDKQPFIEYNIRVYRECHN